MVLVLHFGNNTHERYPRTKVDAQSSLLHFFCRREIQNQGCGLELVLSDLQDRSLPNLATPMQGFPAGILGGGKPSCHLRTMPVSPLPFVLTIVFESFAPNDRPEPAAVGLTVVISTGVT